jgi:hypothetical protein
LRSEYIKITDEILEVIQNEINRTGRSPQAALRGKSEERKAGLTSGIIYSWLRGASKSARAEHVEMALKLWKGLEENPDKKWRYKNYRDDLTPISDTDLEKLKIIREYTALLPSRIFDYCDNAPEHLNANIISLWLNVSGYKARENDVTWVINTCEELLEGALQRLKKAGAFSLKKNINYEGSAKSIEEMQDAISRGASNQE